MKHLEDSTGTIYNLRTIGVSRETPPLKVDDDPAGENINGSWTSALVVKVVPNPLPGTDEISRAAGDSWVGTSGYRREDGTWQRARGFIGTVKNKRGIAVDEVFIVDIPEDLSQSGDCGPLEGTKTSMPAPPHGASQRRLTHSAETRHPGCTGVVRSSSDGKYMAFQAFDQHGIRQIFTISPNGGDAVQQSFHSSDVQSGVRWHPGGTKFCYVWNNCIVIRDLNSADFKAMTRPAGAPPTDLVWSHDGHKIAYNRLMSDGKGNETKQIFIIEI